MKTIILAAGYGTRLYPLTKTLPKALIPIVDEKTILDLLIDKIKPLSEEIILISNALFYEKFVDWSKKRNISLDIINDGTFSNEERLGAIGDLELLFKTKNINTDILVVGSDNIFDWRLENFVEFGKSKNSITIGLYNLGDLKKAKRFGVVQINKDNKVVRLQEKPSSPFSTLIGVCIYYFPQEKIYYIDEFARLHPRELKDAPGSFFSWVYTQEDIYGFVFEGKWFDIGTHQSLEEAKTYFTQKSKEAR